MKKKIAELLVTVVMLFSAITGCGNSAAEPSASETQSADVTEGATTNTDNTEAATNTDNTEAAANSESSGMPTKNFNTELTMSLSGTLSASQDFRNSL